MSKRAVLSALAGIIAVAAPLFVSAHEVYVLTHDEIAKAITMTSPNPFSAIPSQEKLFLIWGAVVAVGMLVVLRFSVSRLFEKVFDPILVRLKKYAPFVARLTFGLSLMASGYFRAFFGPELPLTTFFSPAAASIVGVLLVLLGLAIILGFMTRVMALIALGFFVLTVIQDRTYMLTYANYLGEMILFFILGGGLWSVDRRYGSRGLFDAALKRVGQRLERYSFFILRILFGGALFFASFYAKFLHSNLALSTVNEYHLTQYFPFTPLFLVLGAFIIEALLGICFAVGFEIRFAAIVFTIFLTMSILFFGEAVWPHLILFGVNLTLFFHGYDKYTLEMALFQRKRKGEPVL